MGLEIADLRNCVGWINLLLFAKRHSHPSRFQCCYLKSSWSWEMKVQSGAKIAGGGCARAEAEGLISSPRVLRDGGPELKSVEKQDVKQVKIFLNNRCHLLLLNAPKCLDFREGLVLCLFVCHGSLKQWEGMMVIVKDMNEFYSCWA